MIDIAKCDDFDTASRNSDSNCFRKKKSYSKRLIKSNPFTCDGCVYNKLKKKTL